MIKIIIIITVQQPYLWFPILFSSEPPVISVQLLFANFFKLKKDFWLWLWKSQLYLPVPEALAIFFKLKKDFYLFFEGANSTY